MNLVLNAIGFESAMLIQEHVAATFGAATPTACICDVGHEKISISCVADGISIPHSRVNFFSLLKFIL